MTLTDGMDVARMRQIAEQLVLQSKQLTGVAQDGSASMSRLVEAWQGPDTEFFSQGWTQAGRQCDAFDHLAQAINDRDTHQRLQHALARCSKLQHPGQQRQSDRTSTTS